MGKSRLHVLHQPCNRMLRYVGIESPCIVSTRIARVNESDEILQLKDD